MLLRRAVRWTLTTLAAASAVVAVHGAEPTLPRHPAPSPDGSAIAFSWQGDLWTVPAEGGVARRLTAHPAADRFPVFSSDGTLLAFQSDRAGDADVYVMPADGSEPPTRLTYASADDTPACFTADGGEVVFTSDRHDGVRRNPGVYAVPVTGGTPRLASDATGDSPALSPDGTSLAYVRGSTKWYRSRYRGAANRELWLRTPDGEHVQLTSFDGDDDHPGWLDGHSLAYLSSRGGRKNVHVLDLVTGDSTALTTHAGSDARFPRVAADGSLVAYELEDRIWTVRPGQAPAPLAIDVPSDRIADPVVRRTESDGASDLAVSPDGTLAAFVVRGDLFLTAVRSEEEQELAPPPTVRLTDDPARDSEPAWSPDGDALLFTTRRGGSADLYVLRPGDPEAGWLGSYEFPAEPLVVTDADESAGRFSPGGGRVAYLRGKGDLMVVDAGGGMPTLLAEHWLPLDARWSPDGRWLAYAREDAFANSEIWIVPAAGGEPYNVSRHPDVDDSPEWSPDGRRLLWRARRVDHGFDLWGVWLAREDHERTAEEWLAELRENGTTKPEDEDGGTEGPTAPDVEIDFDRLWERVERITTMLGDEGRPLASRDGRRIVFAADADDGRDLFSVRFDGEDLERLTDGGAEPEALQQHGGSVFYLDGEGRVRRVGLDGTAGDPVPFAARLTIDVEADRAAIFDEAWRVLGDWFYDPEMHGVDWDAARETYRPWALGASSDADFDDVMDLLAGELDGSHLGYYPPRAPNPDAAGFLGASFDPAAGGPGLLVREVLTDSPAAAVGVALEPGDRLLAVDGRPVDPGRNVHRALIGSVGRRVALTVRDRDGGERTAFAEPVPGRELSRLRYGQWVRERRALVDEYSGGRLGYVHIQSMDKPSFEEFERSLYAAAHGKEGLLIDVRSNGGGWTTDYLLTVLMVQRHAWTVPRDAPEGIRAYPTSERLPLAAWTRPAATLCDEESYSNAEIFSHAFQSLGRGPLVGRQTFGAVISTGAHWLLDGARWRIPMRGWYVAATGTNMERNGAVPDVVVHQPPAEDFAAGHDTQLKKAVEVLLEQLETDPRAGAW